MNVLLRPVRSSIGSKYLMAVTGILLIGFVYVHMAGNLLIYAGPDALNGYAHSLQEKGPLLWVARAVLLGLFLLHVVLGVRLSQQNTNARPVAYRYEDTVQASWASRHMLLTGLVLLAFVVYHLAHFTFGIVANADHDLRDPAGHHDVYVMVVAGFRNTWITLSYLAAMVFLWLHLWHGGTSVFQSLGLLDRRSNPIIRLAGPVLATLVLIGNCSIPLSVWLGLIK